MKNETDKFLIVYLVTVGLLMLWFFQNNQVVLAFICGYITNMSGGLLAMVRGSQASQSSQTNEVTSSTVSITAKPQDLK